MIKFENGLVNISGKGIDILAEYAVITYRIKEMFMKDGGKAMKKPELAGMLVGAAYAALFGQNDKEDKHGRK